MKLADRLSRLKWKKLTAALLVLVLIISLAGCGDYDYSSTGSSAVASTDGQISETENTETDVAEADETESTEALDADAEIEADDTEIAASQSEDENESNDSDSQDDADSSSDVKLATSGSAKSNSGSSSQTSSTFDLSTVPAYSGSPYAVVNGNVPYFTSSEITSKSFEAYSNLDALGRCGVAAASVGQDLMPTEARGEIGSVKPTGWHQEKYDFVDGKYVYNRCHLIAFELAGENANEKNLITGTRYMNIQGMLPFENMVADYVKETGNHVMYRVTPEFEGKNLVASGVLMEAESVEDGGDGILFCVYCYNVQPGVTIDYATGYNSSDGTMSSSGDTASNSSGSSSSSSASSSSGSSSSQTYILNTNTKKFHYPSCSSVKQMSDKNKQEYTGSRDDIIAMGYEPCKNCNP